VGSRDEKSPPRLLDQVLRSSLPDVFAISRGSSSVGDGAAPGRSAPLLHLFVGAPLRAQDDAHFTPAYDQTLVDGSGWRRAEGVWHHGGAKSAVPIEPDSYRVEFDALQGVWHLKG